MYYINNDFCSSIFFFCEKGRSSETLSSRPKYCYSHQSVYNSQPSALTYLPFSSKCPIELIKSLIFLQRGGYTDAILEEKSKAKPSGLSRVFDNILSSAKRELRKYKTAMNIPTKKLKLDAFGNCHHVQILTTRIHERNELNDIPSLLLHPLPFFAESAAAEV